MTWRWWAGPALLTLLLVVVCADPYVGDWDALDYTVLAVEGRPSSMLLGRSLFLFTNHLLWRAAQTFLNLPPSAAGLLFKHVVMATAPLAVVAAWRLAYEATRSRRGATLAALLLATSPGFVVYGGQAMTEVPSILLLCMSLALHVRGLRRDDTGLLLAGAALLGAGANVRELALLYAPWLLLAPVFVGRRIDRRTAAQTLSAVAVCLGCALAPFAWLYASDVHGHRAHFDGWLQQSRLEQARHPLQPKHLALLAGFFFLITPVAAVLTIPVSIQEWRGRHRRPFAFGLAAVGLMATLALLLHYSLPANPRYLLTGLPALLPLLGIGVLRAFRRAGVQPAFAASVAAVLGLGVVLGAVPFAHFRVARLLNAAPGRYHERLARLPPHATVVAGLQTMSVLYWRELGYGDWSVVGTGSRWPEQGLDNAVDQALGAGRRVFVDTAPECWPGVWLAPERTAVAQLGERFSVRRASDSFFEVRPRGTSSEAGAFQAALEGQDRGVRNLVATAPASRTNAARRPGGSRTSAR